VTNLLNAMLIWTARHYHNERNVQHALPLQVAFVMPSKYRKVEDLPKPGNPNVSIKETSAQMLAAISWRCADWTAMPSVFCLARWLACPHAAWRLRRLCNPLINLPRAAPLGRTLRWYQCPSLKTSCALF